MRITLLSRRTLLRGMATGVGAALALPFLDAMAPIRPRPAPVPAGQWHCV
jgi:hypothetical protein